MPSHPLCCSSLALQRGTFLSCLILGLVEESQAVLILKPEERHKSCHTPFYDVVGVILSLVEHEGWHVKLELGPAQLYQGKALCLPLIASPLLASCASSGVKCPFPVRITRPPESEAAGGPGKERGEARRGRSSCRLSVLAEPARGCARGPGGGDTRGPARTQGAPC